MRDPAKRKASQARYNATPERQASLAEYRATPERKVYMAKYRATPEFKVRLAKYRATPKAKATQAKYTTSLKGKATQARYNATPERKAAHVRYNATPEAKASAARRHATPEAKAYQARWTKDHPEECKAKAHKRRACKVGNGGSYTPAQWRAKFALHGGLCFYCPAPATAIDHDVPLARGGSNAIGNLLPACQSCNSRKHTQTAAEYLSMR